MSARLKPEQFPNFDEGPLSASQGLGDVAKNGYISNIEAFKRFFPNQPSFYISEASWELLCEGKTSRDAKSWLPPNYEVYAFVFCIAMPKSDLLNSALPAKTNLNYDQYPYFRIRTVIRSTLPVISHDFVGSGITVQGSVILGKPKPPQKYYPPAELEIDIIAFVDIKQAIENRTLLKPLDCLRFTRADGDGYTVDESVRLWRTEFRPRLATLLNKKLDDRIKKPDLGQPIVITQAQIEAVPEGAIFGRTRIEQILKKHTGTVISFALSDKKSERPINFHFKVNPEYATELPCPIPNAC